MEVGLGPGDFVLDGVPAPLPKFLAHVYCGITAGWIKMVLSMESFGDRPQPRRLCVKWKPSRPLNFRPMFTIIIVISLEYCTGARRYWFVQVQVKF